MPKKVLFPSESGNDFAEAGNTIGWVPIRNNNDLGNMADDVISANNGKRIADHAIPSPIAHIKDFRKRLFDNNEDALNEWRGMLAAIALQKIKSLNITIKEIPLFPNDNTGAPTALGSIIFDALMENSALTGFTIQKNANDTTIPALTTLSVFCKDEIPFAMFVPGMVICPFKEYPAELFAGLEWYNDKKNQWIPVRDTITSGPTLSVTAQKLYFWIDTILNNHNNTQLASFQTALLFNLAAPSENQEYAPKPNDYVAGAEVWNELKNVCPTPYGAPESVYSEKMFIIVPPNGHDSSGIERAARFTPKSKREKTKSYYIVPPIHDDVVKCLRNGSATLESWDITPDNAKYTFKFTIQFPNGETMKYTKKYSDSDIVWTDCMPYISLWPDVTFDNDTWKEHFISIWENNVEGGRLLTEYGAFVENKNCQRIIGVAQAGAGDPSLKIKLVSKSSNDLSYDEYECHSDFKDKKFTLLTSESQPYALEFSYDYAGHTYSIGSWIIDRTGIAQANVQAAVAGANRTYYIAMDFGTTSTNVYMREENPNNPFANLRSISSAGKYLCEIFNPYKTNNQSQKVSDFVQNYYLFSSKEDLLGKIFTYGQNFTSTKNSIALGSTVSNASGRAVVVDEDYIIEDDNANSGIYNGLKMRRQNQINPELVRATNNFVSNILTYAVLEARANGAATINLRVSYPAENYANTILNDLNAIVRDLEYKSGLRINLGGATEARAAGEYFAVYVGGTARPIPSHGYAIIDIGGGTTDFSFWKREADDANVMQKDEHSFGYAGNYLVSKTIIQSIKAQETFSAMWQVAKTDSVAHAIDKYNGIDVSLPIKNTLIQPYPQKASALDFLLEKCGVNYGMLENAGYKSFLSAIRMKYYSLFYLIAYYLKARVDCGVIRLSDESFRICLAGCGSKGMDFCRLGGLGASFDDNLRTMFISILSLPAHCAFAISRPPKENKEEVVIGLTIIPNANPVVGHTRQTGLGGLPWGAGTNANNIQPVVAAQPAEAEVSDQALEMSFNDRLTAYQDLLDMLHYFEHSDEDTEHVLHRIDPRVNEKANDHFVAVYAQVDDDLRNSNYDRNTYRQNFALFMLENMINEFI